MYVCVCMCLYVYMCQMLNLSMYTYRMCRCNADYSRVDWRLSVDPQSFTTNTRVNTLENTHTHTQTRTHKRTHERRENTLINGISTYSIRDWTYGSSGWECRSLDTAKLSCVKCTLLLCRNCGYIAEDWRARTVIAPYNHR